MIVDGHAHACGSFLTCEGVELYLKQQNIDRVVLCGGEPDSSRDYQYPMLSKVFWGESLAYFFNQIIAWKVKGSGVADHIKEQNMMVYAMTRKMPDRIFNAYWINPKDMGEIKNMQDFYEHYGFSMVKMHQCWNSFEIDSEVCGKVFAWAGKRNIPVFLHLKNHEQVKKFVLMANRYRTTTFIVAHLIGSKYMRKKLKYKNVYFDLSAPQLYSKRMLRFALRYYGAARLVAGSDTPYGRDNMRRVMKRLKRLKVPKQQYRQIMGDNLKWLLKL